MPLLKLPTCLLLWKYSPESQRMWLRRKPAGCFLSCHTVCDATFSKSSPVSVSAEQRLTCLLPLCAIWGQAMMMHAAQRWHTQWENTLISARLNFTLEDSRSIYSLLNVPKNALDTCWWKDWKRTLTWSSDTGMTTEFSHSLYSIHFLWIPFMRN